MKFQIAQVDTVYVLNIWNMGIEQEAVRIECTEIEEVIEKLQEYLVSERHGEAA